MPSKAQSGLGTILSIGGVTGASGTETFTAVGEVDKPGFTGNQWATVDVTNLQSTAEEFISTIPMSGEINLEGSRVSSDAGQIVVETAYASGLKYDFKLQLPINRAASQTTTGDLYAFSALVLSRDIPISVKEKIGWNVKLKISGPIAFTVGS